MAELSLFIDSKTFARLRMLARLQRLSVEALIHRAIQIVYPAADNQGLLEAFEEVVGLWGDRQGMGTTRQYVGRMRSCPKSRKRAI